VGSGFPESQQWVKQPRLPKIWLKVPEDVIGIDITKPIAKKAFAGTL